MVAAGTGAVVGIGLWVIAEGRYEPQNFPSFVIPQEELVWDWSSSRSNYAELRSRKGALANGRGWEVESSLDLPAPSLEARLKSQLGRTGAGDYAAIPGGDAGVGKTASEVRDEDLGVLLDPSLASVRVTRMRADLVHSALTEDLVLAATSDQAILGTTRRPTRSIHEPPCPEYTCPPESSRDGTTLEGGSCAAGPGDASSGLVLASVVALGFVARARRKRTG